MPSLGTPGVRGDRIVRARLRSALGRPGRSAGGGASEALEDLGVGGQDQPAVLVDAVLVGGHGAQEAVQLGVATVGLGVDRGGLGVGLAHGLLGLLVGLGLDPLELALLLAADLRALPLPLRTVAVGDALALGDHPLEDLGLHRLHVVDALDLHVHQLYAVFGHHLGGVVEDEAGDLVPPLLHVAHLLGL